LDSSIQEKEGGLLTCQSYLLFILTIQYFVETSSLKVLDQISLGVAPGWAQGATFSKGAYAAV
jgi:hypothetical protein